MLWPFLPNIRQRPYDMSREYRTEIIVSRAGKEQRRALRQTPRKRVEYSSGVKGDCLRDFDRAMVTAQRIQQTIPDRVRYVTLTSTLSSDSVVINPVPSWIIEDAELVLVRGSDQEVVTVESVAGTTVIFVDPVATSWPAGSRLHPALSGYLEASILAPLISPRGIVDISVAMNIDPGIEGSEDHGTAETTLGGREVFLKRPNRWLPIDLTRTQEGGGAVDYGFGRVQRFFPIEFSTRVWDGGYTGCDFEHADELRMFFDRMKGRWGEFYMPTWQRDLVPTSGVSSGGTTLSISQETDAFEDSTVFSAIGLRKTNGDWITRAVTNITDTTVTIGSAWGENVSLANIDMVSWLPVWRFASDILTMSWVREDVAEMRMSFQMLENLAVEA